MMPTRALSGPLTWPLTRGDADPGKAFFDALPDPESDIVKEFVNTFIVGLKADGLWNKIDGGNILCLGTEDNALVDFKLPSRVATLAPGFTSTFAAYRGFTGSGSASGSQDAYIDTGFNPASAGGEFAQDSMHIAIFSRTNVALSNWDIGAYDVGNSRRSLLIPRSGGDVIVYTSNNNTLGTIGAGITTSVGFTLLTRTGPASSAVYKNGVQIGTAITTASTGLPSVPVRYLQAQSSAATTRQLSFACYGGGLTAQDAGKLNARVQALIGALTAL